MAKDTNDTLPATQNSKDVAFLDDMEASSGKGFEEADEQSYAIPFLSIIQKTSPQVDTDDPAYNKDAEPGMFLNTVTNDLISGEDGVLVIPCYFRRSVIQWGKRESGGGFIESHPANTPLMAKTVRNESGQDEMPDGTYLVDTRQHYVMIQDKDGMWYPAIVAMSSTQNKKSKKWMTQMSQLMVPGKKGAFTPPMFGQMYRLKTVGESNSKGKWKGWTIEYVGLVNDAQIFKHAQEFHEKVATDQVKAAHDSVAGDDGAGASDGDAEKF